MVRTVLAWAGASGTLTGAAAVTGGPDYAGIALLVSAVAGLLSALTAMVIALRRKPTDPEVVALLREITQNNRQEPEP